MKAWYVWDVHSPRSNKVKKEKKLHVLPNPIEPTWSRTWKDNKDKKQKEQA